MMLQKIQEGDIRIIARSISLIENEVEGYRNLLQSLPASGKKIIGITGPPGAGKSTLVDALINEMISKELSVAVLCIDPSSPFNLGALLGDRIRMNRWFNNPKVFIRSLATRGALGGLHPKIIEISDLIKTTPFNCIIIETVGVGQSEVEIAALADTTVVVVVPESGDDIQTMKAGLMEIGDIFVVNKSDRPGADNFIRSLRLMLTGGVLPHQHAVPVIKTVASQSIGIDELLDKILAHQQTLQLSDTRYLLMAERAYYLIRQEKMKNVDKELLKKQVMEQMDAGGFNLYKYVEDNYSK